MEVSVILNFHARLQSVVYSDLGYVPVRQTTLPHRGARKADGGSENPTADGQRDIKIQEASVRPQPGDVSSSVVRSWKLDAHGRGGNNWTGSSRKEKRVRRPTQSYSEGHPILS